MAETDQAAEKRLSIVKIYVKDFSFESPQAPGVFQAQDWNPQTNLNLRSAHTKMDGDLHEVVLTLTVDAKDNEGDKTQFLVELQQAGIFEITGHNEQELGALIGSFCPNLLFPYAREAIASTVQTAIRGVEASEYRVGEDEYDIRVRLRPESRVSIDELGNLTVPDEDGIPIPIRSVARLETGVGPGAIRRVDLRRVVTIEGDVLRAPGRTDDTRAGGVDGEHAGRSARGHGRRVVQRLVVVRAVGHQPQGGLAEAFPGSADPLREPLVEQRLIVS